MGKDIYKHILTRISNDFLKPQHQSSISNTKRVLTDKILTQIKSGHFKKAVNTVFASPVALPAKIYARLFEICSTTSSIVEARKLEFHLVSFWTPPPTFLLNRAIEVYAKCGDLNDAQDMFDEMPLKDGGSWNAMISGYSRNGRSKQALLLFCRMNKMGVSPNEITFASVLGCCSAVLDCVLSMQVHGLVVKNGLCWNVVLGSSLVDIYGKCGFMDDARRMFDEIPCPNDVSWNVIVRRYLDAGEEEEAVVMFYKMIGTNIRPLSFTFSSALIACSKISALTQGKVIHGVAEKFGFVENLVVKNSLLIMYAKCQALPDAHKVFDQPGPKNVIFWTSIVSGYATIGRTREARKLFNDMPMRNVVSWNAMLAGYTRFFLWEEALDFISWMRRETKDIDDVTVILILNICAGLSDLAMGKEAHGFAYRHCFYPNIHVANAVLDMYGKCGSLKSSKIWFHEMAHLRDRVSWNTLITSYARHHLSEEAMPMFAEMLWEYTPGQYDFTTLLAACANIFALEQGKQIHGYMLRNCYSIDVVSRGALVDMYSKCRCLEYAVKVFKEAPCRDLILWNSILLGCAHNGKGQVVLDLYELMQEEGIKSDNITFQGILLACIGEGFVDLGRQYFESMSRDHCIIPRLEHYECMIELYSRYGFMDELEDFIEKMPFEPTEPMVNRIFDACREHRNSKLGAWAAQRLND
ncbi:hypothetical protein ACHQM5_022895 [Ranunculus cassubicifolius]